MSAPHPDYADNGDPLPAFLRRNGPVKEPVSGLAEFANFKMLELNLPRNRLDDIAILIQSLTYGEMMELAAKLWAARPGVIVDPLSPITKEELPMVWYNWSTRRNRND